MQEGDFLEAVTQSEFERCRIMDKHLSLLASKYFDTRFIKLSAPVRPAASWGGLQLRR